MSKEKKQVTSLMAQYKKHGGGKKVKQKLSKAEALAIESELQSSFDTIFPEFLKKEKQRKHVIFEADIFQFFNALSQERNIPFSVLINTALREFKKNKTTSIQLSINTKKERLKEYIALKKREIELLQEFPDSELEQAINLEKKLFNPS